MATPSDVSRRYRPQLHKVGTFACCHGFRFTVAFNLSASAEVACPWCGQSALVTPALDASPDEGSK